MLSVVGSNPTLFRSLITYLVNGDLMDDAQNNYTYYNNIIGNIRNINGDEELPPIIHSPPPPTYESAVSTNEQYAWMKRLRTYLGISRVEGANIFSPRTSLGQNVCEDNSGLPTYEEALTLK